LDPVDTLDTQPFDPVELLDRDSTPIQPMRRKVAIPHVDNTLHDVTTVSGMDLQTKKTKIDGYHPPMRVLEHCDLAWCKGDKKRYPKNR
jgi:hypothetical protein